MSLPEDRLEQRLPDAKPLYSAVRGGGRGRAAASTATTRRASRPARPASTSRRSSARSAPATSAARRGRSSSANVLGYSCARVCPVEVLCAGACVYNAWDRDPPIAIGRLQRYATETADARRPGGDAAVARAGQRPAGWPASAPGRRRSPARRTSRSRASPSRSSRSARLAGGLNTTGVAPYKMPADDALAEVEFVRSLGVEIRTGVEVAPRPDSPRRCCATSTPCSSAPGLGADARLGIPGESGPGVVGAVEWIERMKLGRPVRDGRARRRRAPRGRDRRRQHRDRRGPRAGRPRRAVGEHALPAHDDGDERLRARARARAARRRRAGRARGPGALRARPARRAGRGRARLGRVPPLRPRRRRDRPGAAAGARGVLPRPRSSTSAARWWPTRAPARPATPGSSPAATPCTAASWS